MPRGDQTGPEGAGPMTGRGMGVCAENNTPGVFRRGIGFGRRMGRGFRNRFSQPVQQIQPAEIESLQKQLSQLEQQLKTLQTQS